MNLYEILQNSVRVGEGMTHFERLFAQKVGGGKISEISGVPPLRYIGDGRPLTDYLLSGNAVQDGTPSADAPVDATGSGVRTDNLAKYWKNAYVKPSSGEVTSQHRNGMAYPVSVSAGQTITFSANADNFSIGIAVFRYFDGTTPTDMIFRELTVYTYTATENCYAVVWCNYDNTTIMSESNFDLCKAMLNLGSTALPYEPYGFKLPLTVNGVEYPIYLGEVQSTRRIKKLVLTGTTRCFVYDYNSRRGFKLPGLKGNYTRAQGICTHYPVYNGTSYNDCLWLGVNDSTLYFVGIVTIMGITEPEEFQAYLAAQYAAGTPVTVWYVLAEPETAIVNEPLMKIGDYADTISFAQAGVTIPTVSGANALDVPTEVKPSEVWIRGRIKEV